jgi:hypothetical protein
MGSTMGFSSNFSIPTTRISRRWSTSLSLSKTRLKRWRRMARGKHHSRDSLWEATSDLACLSQDLSSETRVWFARRCMDIVLHSICNDRTFRPSARTSRCRSLSHRLIDLVCSNHLTRTYNKVLAQPLQPHRMNQLREAIKAKHVSSVGSLVTLHGSALPDRQFLELKIRTSHKGSRISCMAT